MKYIKFSILSDYLRRYAATTILCACALFMAATSSHAQMTTPPSREISMQNRAEIDKGLITTFLEDQLSTSAQAVTIEGFEGALSTRATITKLEVSDLDGPWLIMHDLVLDWDRTALVYSQELIVQELSARLVELPRKPVSPAAPSAQSEPLSFPELPLAVQVEKMDVPEIRLGPDWLGRALNLQVTGAAKVDGQDVQANLEILRRDGITGELKLALSHDYPENAAPDSPRELQLDVQLNEPEDGILVEWLALPAQPPLALRMVGQGPLDEFRADLRIALDGQDKIFGQTLLRNDGSGNQLGIDLAGDLRPFLPAQSHSFFGPASILSLTLARHPEQELNAYRLDDLRLQTASASLQGRADLGADWWPTAFNLTGSIDGNGAPVPLPFGEVDTTLERSTLHMEFDSSQSPIWNGQYELTNLRSGNTAIERATLNLSGEINVPDTNNAGDWSLIGSYNLHNLMLDISERDSTFNTNFSGDIHATGASAQPTILNTISLKNTDIEAMISGQIGRFADELATQVHIDLKAANFAPLSAFAGRALAGSGQLSTDISYNPIQRDLGVSVEGQTHNLELGLARIDSLLAGNGTLILQAQRNNLGTQIQDFSLQTAAAHMTANADLTNQSASADFMANISNSQLISPDLSGPIDISGNIRRRDGGISTLKARAQLPSAYAKVQANLAPAQDNYAGRLLIMLNSTDLAPYSELSGYDLSGQAQAKFLGHGRLSDGSFDLELTANGSALQMGQPQVDALLAGESTISGLLSRGADGELNLDRLQVRTPQMNGTANARHSQTQQSASIIGQIPDASVLAPSLTGPIAFAATTNTDPAGSQKIRLSAAAPHAEFTALAARDAGTAFHFDVRATVDDLTPYGTFFTHPLRGTADLVAQGTLHPDRPEATLQLTANGQDLAVDGVLDTLLSGTSQLHIEGARQADGAFRLSHGQLTGDNVQVTAQGSIHNGIARGMAEAELTDLSHLPLDVTGPASIELTSMAQTESSLIELNATLPGASLDAQVDINSQTWLAEIDGRAQVNSLTPWANLLPQPLTGSGTFNFTGQSDLRTGSFSSTILGSSLRLTNIEPITDRILAGLGQLSAQIERSTDGNLSVPNMSIEFPHLKLSSELYRVQNNTQLRNIDVALDSLALVYDSLDGALRITGSADLNTQSSVNLRATSPNGLSVSLNGPISGAPNLHIQGHSPLAIANTTIAPAALSGDGYINLHWRGGGLTGLNGEITTRQSRLSVPDQNFALNNLTGRIDISGAQAIADLRANDTHTGQVALSGTMALDDRLNANLKASLNQVTLRNPALYTTQIDGQLEFNGPIRGGGGVISGEIRLPNTEITVPSSGIGGLTPLPEIRHLQPPQAVLRSLERAGLTPAGIDKRLGGNANTGDGARAPNQFPLNIQVSAPERVFVRGRGIDAELGGSFTLGGTNRHVIPAGRLELIRGRVNILQQRFDLVDGYGALEGDFTPYIGLTATTEREGIITEITISGDVMRPEIRFSSVPELPEDEVLARLIFGRNLEQISALQAVQLASAINTLSGGTDIGLTSKLRTSLYLDDLDITANDNGDAELRAGKYLNDDTYADIAIDDQGTADVSINLNLTDDLTLRGSSSTDGESTIGLFFERDY